MLAPDRIDELLSEVQRHEHHLTLVINCSKGDPKKPPSTNISEIYQRLIRTRSLRSHLEHALWEAEYYALSYQDDLTPELNPQKVAIMDAIFDTANTLTQEQIDAILGT